MAPLRTSGDCVYGVSEHESHQVDVRPCMDSVVHSVDGDYTGIL